MIKTYEQERDETASFYAKGQLSDGSPTHNEAEFYTFIQGSNWANARVQARIAELEKLNTLWVRCNKWYQERMDDVETNSIDKLAEINVNLESRIKELEETNTKLCKIFTDAAIEICEKNMGHTIK